MATPTSSALAAPRFGKPLLKEFGLDPKWRNLNHGSYGGFPREVHDSQMAYQNQARVRPDQFVYYEYPKLLDQSRESVARVVNAPTDTVVFVPNATTAVNTVLRNLAWNADKGDVVITFSTIFRSCDKAVDFLVDTTDRVSKVQIPLVYPIEDDEIVRKFRATVKDVEVSGKRARLCIFDAVVSIPGVVFPWQEMAAACRELGVLSLVDGAQGIGMVPLDLQAADPDFFVSNCHKWLFAPKPSAVFYVPRRNQHLIPATLAVGYTYVPGSAKGGALEPYTGDGKVPFVTSFGCVATRDNSAYLATKTAIEWRETILGGEEPIRDYVWDLNRKGSDVLATALGTRVMENSKGTLRNCGMANVALPIWTEEGASRASETDTVVLTDEVDKISAWMHKKLVGDWATSAPIFVHDSQFWIRVSAQVYLDMDDYTWIGGVMKDLCGRVSRKEYVQG